MKRKAEKGGKMRRRKTAKGKASTLLSLSSADDVVVILSAPFKLCIRFTLPPAGWTGCPPILCFPRLTFDAKLLHFDPPNGLKLNLVAFTGLKRRKRERVIKRRGAASPLATLLNTFGIKQQFCSALHRSQLSKYFPLYEVYFCCYPIDEASAAAALSISQSRFKQNFFEGSNYICQICEKDLR